MCSVRLSLAENLRRHGGTIGRLNGRTVLPVVCSGVQVEGNRVVLPAICYEVCAAPSVMRFVVGLVAVEVLAVICTHFVSIGRHWPDKVLATRYFLETREVRETQYL